MKKALILFSFFIAFPASSGALLSTPSEQQLQRGLARAHKTVMNMIYASVSVILERIRQEADSFKLRRTTAHKTHESDIKKLEEYMYKNLTATIKEIDDLYELCFTLKIVLDEDDARLQPLTRAIHELRTLDAKLFPVENAALKRPNLKEAERRLGFKPLPAHAGDRRIAW